MEKGCASLILVLFASILLINFSTAMDGPITVQAEPGERVIISAWIPGGSLLNRGEGTADEEGFFSSTFFSLSEPTINLQVRTISGKNIRHDQMFEGQSISDPLLINCVSSSDCSIAIDTRPETLKKMNDAKSGVASSSDPVVEDEVTEESTTKTPESEDEIAEENKEDSDEKSSDESTNEEDKDSITGLAIFTKADGSVDWVYAGSVGGLVIILLAISVFMVKKRRTTKRFKGNGDLELEELEEKVKAEDEEIKNLKVVLQRKDRIEAAKKKLADDEEELKSIKNKTQPQQSFNSQQNTDERKLQDSPSKNYPF